MTFMVRHATLQFHLKPSFLDVAVLVAIITIMTNWFIHPSAYLSVNMALTMRFDTAHRLSVNDPLAVLSIMSRLFEAGDDKEYCLFMIKKGWFLEPLQMTTPAAIAMFERLKDLRLIVQVRTNAQAGHRHVSIPIFDFIEYENGNGTLTDEAHSYIRRLHSPPVIIGPAIALRLGLDALAVYVRYCAMRAMKPRKIWQEAKLESTSVKSGKRFTEITFSTRRLASHFLWQPASYDRHKLTARLDKAAGELADVGIDFVHAVGKEQTTLRIAPRLGTTAAEPPKLPPHVLEDFMRIAAEIDTERRAAA